MAACASQLTREEEQALYTAPKAPIQKTVTSFQEALQCMDDLFLENDIRDIGVLLEELGDATGKVKVGTRDMMIAAISEMTRKSGAIRVNSYGSDIKNTIEIMKAGGQKSAAAGASVPEYALRGSISQIDDGVTQEAQGGGIVLGPVSFGKKTSSSTSTVSVDLSVITTKDFTVIPGVTSNNTVVVRQTSSGSGDGGSSGSGGSPGTASSGGAAGGGGAGGWSAVGSIHKNTISITYNFNLSTNEGRGQAVRNLMQLGSIELLGKLTRVPYWHCLGLDNNEHPVVQEELKTWYHTLTRDGELIKYLKKQLALHGHYHGPIDASMNKDLQRALRDFAKDRGRKTSGAELDFELFAALTTSRLKQGRKVALWQERTAVYHAGNEEPARAEGPAPAPAGPSLVAAGAGLPADRSPAVEAAPAKAAGGGLRIEPVDPSPGRLPKQLRVSVGTPANVICVVSDSKKQRQARVFPGDLAKAKVGDKDRLQFKLSRSAEGLVLVYEAGETPRFWRGWDELSCVATRAAVGADASPGTDFAPAGSDLAAWRAKLKTGARDTWSEATWRAQ